MRRELFQVPCSMFQVGGFRNQNSKIRILHSSFLPACRPAGDVLYSVFDIPARQASIILISLRTLQKSLRPSREPIHQSKFRTQNSCLPQAGIILHSYLPQAGGVQCSTFYVSRYSIILHSLFFIRCSVCRNSSCGHPRPPACPPGRMSLPTVRQAFEQERSHSGRPARMNWSDGADASRTGSKNNTNAISGICCFSGFHVSGFRLDQPDHKSTKIYCLYFIK